jgi:hypothetical protein
MSDVLREQTEAGIASLRCALDSTSNMGLRIYLMQKIDEIESALNGTRPLFPQPPRSPRPVCVYFRKSMRRIKA